MKKKLTIYVFVFFFLLSYFSSIAQRQQLKLFPLSAVTLTESDFLKAQQADYKYMMALDPDRLLAPFVTEAGLQPKAKSYESWENTGLDGQTGGHYLSALSNMYAATKDETALKRLKYMIDELERCQKSNGNGYVGGVPGGKIFWQDVANGKIDADGFSLNGKWVPWYNIHKLFAGLIDAYEIAGIQKAKDMVVRLSDWALQLTSNLTDAQMQDMLRCEHGGMNEALANIASITGDYKYLQLAKRFSHRAILNPLLKNIDSLTGLHANTQIPKVIGFMRIAEINKDESWGTASKFFWETVVNKRSVAFGGNSVREHFNPVNNFIPLLESREGPETCNSYNMLKLTKHLFLQEPSATYLDYYERTIYNHILSSQHPDGGFVYFTPIRPGHYRVYSQAQKDFWCCVGSGIENHGKYGELIYAHDGNDLFVNLFIPSTLQWKEKGISITQQTKFPYEEQSTVKLKINQPQKFIIKIRKPSWVKNDGFKVLINGKEQSTTYNEKSYVSINKLWKSGDVITVKLPMQTNVEPLPDGSDWAAFVHGPILLAAITDNKDITGIKADGSRMGHIASGPFRSLESAPLFITSKENLSKTIAPIKNKPLTFRISGDIEPASYQNLELVPFYTIHDARYVMYWPFTTAEGLQKRQEAIKLAETEKLDIEKKIIDEVAPGEQQPESDHNFKGEKTESGLHADRHWRHSSGWFSYDLKNKTKDAKSLRIMYWGGDSNRTFDILVNNIQIATVRMDGAQDGKFVERAYHLPTQMINNQPDTITVKFQAHKGSVAGGIYNVRLLR